MLREILWLQEIAFDARGSRIRSAWVLTKKAQEVREELPCWFDTPKMRL